MDCKLISEIFHSATESHCSNLADKRILTGDASLFRSQLTVSSPNFTARKAYYKGLIILFKISDVKGSFNGSKNAMLPKFATFSLALF